MLTLTSLQTGATVATIAIANVLVATAWQPQREPNEAVRKFKSPRDKHSPRKLDENDLSRIVGGSVVTNPDKYPFYANTYEDGHCGATLIHADILLTAAHCYEPPGLLGLFNPGFDPWSPGIQIGGIELGEDGDFIEVDRIRQHPDWNPRNFENDIMLVKLSEPSTQTLVAYNSDTTYPDDGDPVTAIG